MIELLYILYVRYGRIVRYGIVGVIGGMIQEAVLFFWIDALGLFKEYKLGVVLGFVCSLAVVFPLQKYWTFREISSERLPRQFFLYSSIAIFSLVANVFFMHLFVGIMHVNPYIAQAITIMIVAGSSFLMNRSVTFVENSKKVVIEKSL